jgi:hypothetical protein
VFGWLKVRKTSHPRSARTAYSGSFICGSEALSECPCPGGDGLPQGRDPRWAPQGKRSSRRHGNCNPRADAAVGCGTVEQLPGPIRGIQHVDPVSVTLLKNLLDELVEKRRRGHDEASAIKQDARATQVVR